jgi:hypothetical protein
MTYVDYPSNSRVYRIMERCYTMHDAVHQVEALDAAKRVCQVVYDSQKGLVLVEKLSSSWQWYLLNVDCVSLNTRKETALIYHGRVTNAGDEARNHAIDELYFALRFLMAPNSKLSVTMRRRLSLAWPSFCQQIGKPVS